MEITNVRVYDIEESIIESGLPKSSNPEYSIDRAQNLGNAKIGSGHDCYLKGIVVRFRLQADHSFWLQLMRYHFSDIVSSESKMHCITQVEPKYHCFVSETNKRLVERLIEIYNVWPVQNNDEHNFLLEEFRFGVPQTKEEMFEAIVMCSPIGLELVAGISTNYLQLKSIYNQRKNHKMSSWKSFCEWIESLPNSELMLRKLWI